MGDSLKADKIQGRDRVYSTSHYTGVIYKMMSESYLLVTTSRSLLLVETQHGTCFCLDTGRDHYYGITRDIGHYYVGVRYRFNTSKVPKELESGKIIRFNLSGEFLDEIAPEFPLRDIHQILIYDGRLWVTCPYDNKIAIFDGFDWEAWYPLGVSNQPPLDINHFNSISVFGNKLCVLAHNFSARTGRTSELYFFQLPNLQLDSKISLGSCSHNVWMHKMEIMTCSSLEGCLVGQHGSRIVTGGFPRGVAYSMGEINVGISEFASRPDRDLGKGWIKIYDRNWNFLRKITFADEGMITDMISLSVADAQKIVSNKNVTCISCTSISHDSELK